LFKSKTAFHIKNNIMANRRDFLKIGSLGLPFFLLSPSAWGKNASISGNPPVLKKLRFGLFFDDTALPTMRAQFATNPMFAAFKKKIEAIDRKEERKFLDSGLKYNELLFGFLRLHNNAELFAFYYLMTDDRDAGQLAVDMVRCMMKFPKWDYFLETGNIPINIQRGSHGAFTVAICADWVGDLITEDERRDWVRKLGERGCEPCYRTLYGLRYKDQVKGWSMDRESDYFVHRPGDIIDLSRWPWILDKTNLKAVPTAALATAAVVYKQMFGASADTERWIAQAMYSHKSFDEVYSKDGSYEEGISYANYTSINLALSTEVLRRFEQIDLFDVINWPGFSQYQIGLSMPTSAEPTTVVNFGDASFNGSSGVSFWIANNAHDAQSQWHGEHLANEHNVWSVAWYNPNAKSSSPTVRPTIWVSDLEWLVARTGYAPKDLVVAMRSGGPSNHEHADRNSITMKCFGEKLIADPLKQPYSYSDPSWLMRTSLGHSGLLIDGKGHQYHDGHEGTNASKAAAHIIRRTENNKYLAWTSDATPAYQMVMPNLQSVTRTAVILLETQTVILIDKVISSTPCSLQARFFADNLDGKGSIQASGTSASMTIQRPAAHLKAMAFGTDTVTFKPNYNTDVTPNLTTVSADTKTKHPYADAVLPASSQTPLLITVLQPINKATPATAAAAPSIEITKLRPNTYQVSVTVRNKTTKHTIYDTDRIPEFE
jgi:hypothetical protein